MASLCRIFIHQNNFFFQSLTINLKLHFLYRCIINKIKEWCGNTFTYVQCSNSSFCNLSVKQRKCHRRRKYVRHRFYLNLCLVANLRSVVRTCGLQRRASFNGGCVRLTFYVYIYIYVYAHFTRILKTTSINIFTASSVITIG